MSIASSPRRNAAPVPSEELVMNLISRIQVFVTPRRVRVREFFLDFDRLRCGRCSKTQFARALNLVGVRLADQEADSLALYFADTSIQAATGPDFKVNYEKFCDLVDGVKSCTWRLENASFPRSDWTHKPTSAEWSHKNLSPVKKVQSKVVEFRVRLYEHFQDFDALRKGYCTNGQVKTVLTILGLDKQIDQNDFRALQDIYSRSDGMFCYADFCADIDLAFTMPGLEKDPVTQPTMPNSLSTLPARRNRQTLSDTQIQQVEDLEERIRARVKNRRCLLRSAFQDMDRTRRGHVTRSQFARVMCMLGFELQKADVDALCSMYCDIGNLVEINYIDFCHRCDPKTDYEEAAASMTSNTLQEIASPRYFDSFGQVHRILTPRATMAQ